VQGNKWLWYTMLLAAVGVAAFYIVKKTSGDEGSGAAAAAAAASVASGSNLQGSGKAATTSFAGDSGSREVSYVITATGVDHCAVWERKTNGEGKNSSVSGRAIVALLPVFIIVCAQAYAVGNTDSWRYLLLLTTTMSSECSLLYCC
jgi:hypothetical protein